MRAGAAATAVGLSLSCGLVACNLVSGVDQYSLTGAAGSGGSGATGGGGSGGAGGSGAGPDAGPGRTLWSRSFGSPLQDGVSAVATFGTEPQALIAGFTSGVADFHDGWMSATTPGVYVARVDGEGATTDLVTFATGLPATGLQPALALSSAGTAVLAGGFDTDVDLGAGMLSGETGRQLFVAGLGPANKASWSMAVGIGAFFQTPHLAIDAGGNTFLFVDAHGGQLTLGSQGYQNSEKNAAYLAKLDQGGAVSWSRPFANAEFVYASSVVVDRSDGTSAYVVGKADGGGLDCGCPEGPLMLQPYAMFVARYDGEGKCVRQVSYGSNTPPHGAAVDAQGNLLLVGGHAGGFSVESTQLEHSGGNFNFDVYVLKLDVAGKLVWARSFGAAGVDDVADEVVVDEGGDVLVTGHIGGTVDVGNGVMLEGKTKTDLFVVRYRGSDGTALWARRFANLTQLPVLYAHLAADQAGDLLVGGLFEQSIDFGDADSPHAAAGGLDGYLAKLAAN
jgi:hypothetical protein